MSLFTALIALIITILIIQNNEAFQIKNMIRPYKSDRFNPCKSCLKSVISTHEPSLNVDNYNAAAPSMKLGVLFLNLGGPETQDDVEGFLYNLFADPDIIRLPSIISILQKPLAVLIAKRRAPKSSAAYKSIGGGSPIVKYTEAQARLIEESLMKCGLKSKCYFAMRYWNPYTEEVLERMRADEINSIVIVPLYPQFSISTSGSSLRLLQEIFIKQPDIWGPDKMKHTVVSAWYYRTGYVSAMAKLIREELKQYSPEERREGLHVLFSAHGVPQSYINAGDPYQRQIEECIRLIAREIQKDMSGMAAVPGEPPLQIHLSFQSRVGPVQWLRPYTEDKIKELGESGVKNLCVVPVSFVSEHIETLEEIDMEYRELAEEHGVVNWRRVPALNTDDTFISDMRDLVLEAISSPAVSVTEATTQTINDIIPTSLDESLGMRKAERVNGRMAMLGITATAFAELVSGHPVLQSVGFGH